MATLDGFGARLAAVRRHRGLSQEALARKAEMASGTISKYETGGLDPTLSSLTALARSLDTSIGWLGAAEGASPLRSKRAA